MALIVKDRVRETSTTTGTGTITLGGAFTGFRSFADIGNANTTYYCISGGSQFEVGIGTYTASGTTLSRDTVLSNSLGTTALIDFSAGTKDVFVTYPSDKALLGTTGAVSSTGTGSVVLSTSPTLVTPVLGTPTSATLTNATGLPIVDGTTGTLSVARGGTGVTTSTGTGNVVLSASPTLTGTLTAATITASANSTFNGVAIGKGAANISTNLAVGQGALTNALTTGGSNVGVGGTSTMTSLTTGTFNMALGGNALANLTTGSENVAMGVSAVERVTTGISNTGVGAQAMRSPYAGSNNVGIGKSAGSSRTGAEMFDTSNGVYIGALCLGAANAETNAIVIGQGAQGLGSNTTVIGKSTTTITKVFGAIQSTTYTVGTLPSASTVGVGARAFVTDATLPVFGAAVAGGGAVPVPVYSTGSAWNVG